MSRDDTNSTNTGEPNSTNTGEPNSTNTGEPNSTNTGEPNSTNAATRTDTDPAPRDAHGRRAVIAARDRDATPDTTEIRGLAVATGYTVVGEITQRRREDPTYGLGRGAAEDLMRLVAERDADAVIYDGELSPGQTYSLGELLPAGVAV
ncbi:HflX family GTPase, partial [Halorubrum tibetense]